MIFVGANLRKLDIMPLISAKADFFVYFVKHHSSVLRWEYQVIDQHYHVVVLVFVFAYLSRYTVMPHGRENLPP